MACRNEYIKRRLENWGRWASEGQRCGVGYPSQSSIARLMPSGGGSGEALIPVSALDAEQINRAVESLRTGRVQLYKLARLIYVDNKGVSGACKELARAESTVRASLAELDWAVDAWLRGQDGGLTT